MPWAFEWAKEGHNIVHLIFKTFSSPFVRIKCDGTPYTHHFKHLFSLDIYLEGDSQIHLVQGEHPKVSDVARINVLTEHGSLEKDKPVLKATLEVDADCSLVDRLKCEINGYFVEEAAFRKIQFKPRIHADETIRSGIIDQYKKTVVVDEASLINCSADVGTSHAEWSWQVLTPGEIEYTQVHQDSVQAFPTSLEQCNHHMVSRLIYINKEPGNISFRCSIGGNVVGEISAVVQVAGIVDKNEEALGTVLTISTNFLVYTHFILLPPMFSKCQVFTYRGYLAFTVMESFLILMYGAIRCLSKSQRDMNEGRLQRIINKNRKGLLNNAKVSTSFGAVLLPITF